MKLTLLSSSLLAVVAACGSHTPTAQPSSQPAALAAQSAALTTIAREELRTAMEQWHAEAGTVVALDLETGAVLAAIGRNATGDDDARAAGLPVITGSTLKTITHALALDAGVVTPETVLDCRVRTWGDKKIEDSTPHEDLTVREALAVSSNVCASRLLDKMGFDRWLAGTKKFHLGEAPATWPTVTDGTSFDAAMLAGGELGPATAVQLAAAYGVIFREGNYLPPVAIGAPVGKPEPVVSAATAQTMLGLLENVITSPNGTGNSAAITGHKVAGKTGTMPLDDKRNYASFVGRVLDGPKIVLLVGIVSGDDGAVGGKVAGPAFAKIMQRMMK